MKSENSGSGFKTWYAISFAFQLGFIVVIPLAGFILLGLGIDKILNTFPLFLLAGVVAGFVMTIYEVYHFLAILIKEDD